MRASDVVTQIASRLPQLSGAFTTDIEVNSLTRAGTIITANCDDPHGLEPGDAVSITGAFTPLTIPIGLLSRSGVTGTLKTTTPHDLTEIPGQTVVLSGNTVETEFNGTFTLLSTPDRHTLLFTLPDSGAELSTVEMTLENGESVRRDYNRLYQVVETPTPVDFTFVHSGTTLPDAQGTIVARTRARVAAAVNPERAIAAYTEQAIGDAWLFVILEDVNAAKDRKSQTDGIANQSLSNEFRQQISQPFTVYLFLPVREDITGAAEGRDAAEDLFQPICKSVLGKAFDSGLNVGAQGRVHFFGHRSFEYNPAVYVHAFSFEQTVDLYIEDTIGPEDDVAFRDIDLTIFPRPCFPDDVTPPTNITSTIDLDPTPIVPDVIAWQGRSPDVEQYMRSIASPIGVVNAWSIACWWRRNRTTTNFHPWTVRGAGVPGRKSEIDFDSNGSTGMIMIIQDKNGLNDTRKLYQVRSLPDHQTEQPLAWEQFVWTWDGTDLLCYFQGALLPFSDPGGGLPWVTKLFDDALEMDDIGVDRNIVIGSQIDAANEFGNSWNGLIYNWGLWSTVKSAAEVSALYNAGAGGEVDYRFTAGKLEHYYDFSDSSNRYEDKGTATILLDLDDTLVGLPHTFVVDNFPGAP